VGIKSRFARSALFYLLPLLGYSSTKSKFLGGFLAEKLCSTLLEELRMHFDDADRGWKIGKVSSKDDFRICKTKGSCGDGS